MLEALKRLNAEFEAESQATGKAIVPVRMGIGLNTGECVVGNVGSPQRFDYSVLGDVVNVAARFEEETKAYSASIIVGERTAAEAPHFALLELGAVTPRGKDRPEIIFALLGDEAFAETPSFREWEKAHAAFLSARSEGDPARLTQALQDCLKYASGSLGDYYRKSAAETVARA
jgi:adenylate cyclase